MHQSVEYFCDLTKNEIYHTFYFLYRFWALFSAVCTYFCDDLVLYTVLTHVKLQINVTHYRTNNNLKFWSGDCGNCLTKPAQVQTSCKEIIVFFKFITMLHYGSPSGSYYTMINTSIKSSLRFPYYRRKQKETRSTRLPLNNSFSNLLNGNFFIKFYMARFSQLTFLIV